MNRTDAIVVGAGVVGCAIALRLREQNPDLEVLVLDRKEGPFREASRYNSGVVHSGIHQSPHLLRSRFARTGAPMLLRFCEAHNVPVRKSGMLIAVSRGDAPRLFGEVASLFLLLKNSRTQKIPVRFLTAHGIRKLEPAVHAAFGFYLPDIWVVDQVSLGRALHAAIVSQETSFVFNANVYSLQRRADHYELKTTQGEFAAPLVVNAAGISADKIAGLAGVNGYVVHPCRGEYYEVVGQKKELLRDTPVYPALPPGHPVKGIHLTKSVDGRLLIGPNATSWIPRKDDFSKHSPPHPFLDAARRFLPDLKEEDLRWAYSGIRTKLSAPGIEGQEDDFVIQVSRALRPTLINLIGIESPGFTASFAIAKHVCGEIAQRKILRNLYRI